MTGRWNKHKTKKSVETSLGQAPKEDLSHLKRPIPTSISGLKQVISLFQTATAEVKDYITYECDVLYECRTCRTIFRSLANFILHKRNYCKEKFSFFNGGVNPNGGGFVVGTPEERVSPTPEFAEETDENSKKRHKRAISPIIDKLVKRQEVNLLAKDTLNEDLSNKLDDDVVFVSEEKESQVVLQKIDTSEAAVFQTAMTDQTMAKNDTELMKSEVLEIHGILENNDVVLGSNGKVCNFETKKLPNPNLPRRDLVCTECNFTFSTEKTLTHHIKYKHNKTCIVYPCPDCRETFANAWSVYRHLFKVHRRTGAQVRRMRAQIHSSGIRKDQEKEKKVEANVAENEENQWMRDLEKDKDLQMCGGCGKRFERKAALQSHSQMCTKRIAVCNTIKKGESKNKIEKIIKVGGAKVAVKGAAKRKSAPVFIRKAAGGYTEDEIVKRLDQKGTLMAKLDPKSGANKGSEVIGDSDDEKENSPKVSDVTITKCSDEETQPEVQLPEIEIFTISDDSSDETDRQLSKTLDLDSKIPSVSDDYKEFLNDELDQCFFTKVSPHIDQNSLKCVSCQATFASQYQLLWHMSLHFDWYRYQCSKCSFLSFNRYDCTTHAYANHGTPNNLMGSTVLPIPKWKVLVTAHDFVELVKDEKMPCLEAVGDVSAPEEASSETIVVEDDEMPDICSVEAEKAGPSTCESVAKSRPIRNRVRSVKTLQNDFIYDLGNVLKMNDNSIKVSKLKKSLTKR